MKFSKEIKAGLIAVIAIVGFVLLFQFMKGKSFFTTDNTFYVKYDNVSGLQKSSQVSIKGLKVGQVDDIVPITTADGKLHFLVKILVDDDYSFSKNSTVEIFAPGLMDDIALKINLVNDAPMAKNGDTLIGKSQISLLDNLSSQAGPIKDQLESALKSFDSLANNANKIMDEQNRAEIKALLTNLNRTVTAYGETSKHVNALMDHNDARLQNVLDNASKATQSASGALDKYGNMAEELDVKKLNATIDRLSQTAEQLNGVISGIQNGHGSLGKLAKDEELYQNLADTSANLNILVKDLKENPKKYINISVFGKK